VSVEVWLVGDWLSSELRDGYVGEYRLAKMRSCLVCGLGRSRREAGAVV
jgi:hypothetical protein